MEEGDQSFSGSNCSLEEYDWDGLLELCKEKEEKLTLAGTYGLQLNEQLNDAQCHIEQMRLEHDTEMEKLVQESFELRNKLELKDKALNSQQHEYEEYQKQALIKHNEEKEEIENTFKKECANIKKDKEQLHSEFEQVSLREHHALEKIQCLEEKIINLQNEVKKKMLIGSPSKKNETFENEGKMFELEDLVEKNFIKIKDLQNENQTLALELKSRTAETTNLNQELEEVERKSTSYYNHLQIAREETVEAKAELDALKNEMRGSGHLDKGNSLFGEVDDERRDMKKKLSTFQIKYESINKAYTFLLSQNRSMKAQVVALLQMNSGKADVERIGHLERALSQANAENLNLSAKIKEAESKQELSSDGLKALAKTLPDFHSNKDMIDFLMIQINQTKEKLEKQREEIDYTSMMKLAESEKLMKSEQKLYESDCLSDKFRNENMKLRLKLEETKNKLDAETQKRVMIEKKFNYDSKDDVMPLGIASNNQQTKEKKLPYTLAKAQEKANEKSQRLNSNSLWGSNESVKREHHTLDQSYQHQSDKIHSFRNKENIFSNHIDTDEKQRKVSFRDTPETIPEACDAIKKEDLETNETIDTTTPKSGINKTALATTSALKKKTLGNRFANKNIQPKGLSKRASIGPSISTTKKSTTDEEQDCKMQ